jgi:isopentenyldiphosphate isomerase
MNEELLEIVDAEGNVIGRAPRREIHGNPGLMHRVVHVLVFNADGDLILQKRSMDKDVAPGRWDTSVGGHVDPGETLEHAARREMHEELGFHAEPVYLYSYVHSNEYETEQVHTFTCIHTGPITFNPEEIDEVRPWSIADIMDAMDSDLLSDNFRHEFTTFLAKGMGGER